MMSSRQEGAVGLGQHDHVAAGLQQAAARRVAVPLLGFVDEAGRRPGDLLAVSRLALLSTTTTSSTTPVAKKPSITSRIESRSAYVISTTETSLPFHMVFLRLTRLQILVQGGRVELGLRAGLRANAHTCTGRSGSLRNECQRR